MITFEVRRDDFANSRFVESDAPELKEGQVLFALDRFALTSNNVTYAVAGDMLDYWGFFPAEVPEGARYFGFYPMTSHLVVQAQGSAAQFVDAAPHREKHAPAYRQYANAASDPQHSPEREDAILLLRGLFITSFLVDDFIADNGCFGADRFVVSSASSKTAIALAFQLARRGRGEVIGLTSSGHAAFVESLGCYDRVVSYDDHSGAADTVNRVHRHFAGNLVHSCTVGMTHWSEGGREQDLPGAEPTFFFAPGQIAKRSKDWGPAGFQEKVGLAWTRFADWSDGWLEVVRGRGREPLRETWLALLGGRARPHQGHVLSLR